MTADNHDDTLPVPDPAPDDGRPRVGDSGSLVRIKRGDTGYLPSAAADTELMVPALMPTTSGKLQPSLVPRDAQPVDPASDPLAAATAAADGANTGNPGTSGDTRADTRRQAEQTVMMKQREGWGEPFSPGLSITVDGQRFTRISDEDALARVIAGEPLEGCYIKSLHLGYQTDTWVKPSDVGTTRYLARHFKVPEQLHLGDDSGETIKVLKYTAPVRIIGCHIESFSAVGVTFQDVFEMRSTRIAGAARLAPPDAEDLERETTVIPPTAFENDCILSGSTVNGDLLITRGSFVGLLALDEAHVDGSILAGRLECSKTFNASRLRLGNDFHARCATFGGGLDLTGARVADKLELNDSRFDGPLLLERATISAANLAGVTLNAGLNAESARIRNEFAMREATVRGEFNCSVLRSGGDFVVSGSEFHGPVNCYRLKSGDHLRAVKTVFHDDATFRDTSAVDSADFREVVFAKAADFRRSYFAQWAIFFQARFATGADFFGARFEGECLFNRDRSARDNWGDSLEQNVASVGGPVSFSGAYFYRKAVFDGVEFPQDVRFDHAYFAEQGSFVDCTFHGVCDLAEALANQELDFTRATFEKRLNLGKANLAGPVDLAEAKLSAFSCAGAQLDRLIVERWQVEDSIRADVDGQSKSAAARREEYTILKSCFARRGMLDEEDWAHASFKRAQRRALLERLDGVGPEPPIKASAGTTSWMRFKSKFEMVVFDWFTEYGTNPNRTVLLAFLMIFLFGSLYTLFDIAGEPLVWQGAEFEAIGGGYTANGVLEGWEQQDVFSRFAKNVYFSFMAFTTMGFGDVHPNFDGWVKYFVAIEAFLGVFLMTLFVGTYARKIIR